MREEKREEFRQILSDDAKELKDEKKSIHTLSHNEKSKPIPPPREDFLKSSENDFDILAKKLCLMELLSPEQLDRVKEKKPDSIRTIMKLVKQEIMKEHTQFVPATSFFDIIQIIDEKKNDLKENRVEEITD